MNRFLMAGIMAISMALSAPAFAGDDGNKATATTGNVTNTLGGATASNGPINNSSGASATGIVGGNNTTSIGPTNIDNTVRTNVDNTVRSNIDNTAVNVNGQRQSNEQGQGQTQSTSSTSGAYSDQDQTQSVQNSGNSSNTNRTGDVTGNTSTNSAAQTVRVDGDSIVYEASKMRANSAYAAPSIIGGGVCAYVPASAGLTTFSFGLSGSGAKIDKGCQNRANADILARLGYVRQAAALLMQDKDVAKAFDVVTKAEASE